MTDQQAWWGVWAPYWEEMENQHFSTFVVDEMEKDIHGPVLVVGSGLGLIVHHLRAKGFEVYGLDLDPTMLRMSREKRDLLLVRGDAQALPFKKNAFKTVIISSGVVDYVTDPALIRRMLHEAMRVLMPYGHLFAAFYQNAPRIEAINRRLGILVNGEYRLRRIFELNEAIGEMPPMRALRMVRDWTGRNMLVTIFNLARTGIFLPPELKEYEGRVHRIYKQAERDGIGTASFIANVPERVPYRTQQEVRSLLTSIGFYYHELITHSDCLTVHYCKLGMVNEDQHAYPAGARAKKDLVITTRELVKRYPGAQAPAVDQLSLEVEGGTVFGILGPNGAGKTTTLSMLCGLLHPDSGEIRFAGSLAGEGIRKKIGFVPQDLAIYPNLTAVENLAFFGRLYGLSGKQLDARTNELLRMVGLAERGSELVRNYSTGMMRRLNLVAGLLHEPALILLDEPTVGIDPQSRNCIYEAIHGLRERGVTILYTTHYMEEAAKLCDRVAIMDHGRVILEEHPVAAVEQYGLHRIEFITGSEISRQLLDELQRLPGVFHASCADRRLRLLARVGAASLETVENVIGHAKKRGAALTLRQVQEPTLESLFLDITGRNLRDF